MSAEAVIGVDDAGESIVARSSFWSRARRSPTVLVGGSLTSLILLILFLAPVLARHNPDTLNLTSLLSGPTSQHWLGTDDLGRDEWARVLYGGRTDIEVGVVTVLFPLIFGVAIGTFIGYVGGVVDTIVMRVVDVVLAFPFYVLIIALVAFIGAGVHGIFLAFGLTDWVVYARLTRSSTIVARHQDWVAAAVNGGVPRWRVLLRHIIPNTISQSLVYVMSDIVLVILAVVTLGYLGLGLQPPSPDWGAMIGEGQAYIFTNQWQVLIPGIALLLTGTGFSLLGDGLADVLRPQ
jgi:peptide/nickel transport system permease protein